MTKHLHNILFKTCIFKQFCIIFYTLSPKRLLLAIVQVSLNKNAFVSLSNKKALRFKNGKAVSLRTLNRQPKTQIKFLLQIAALQTKFSCDVTFAGAKVVFFFDICKKIAPKSDFFSGIGGIIGVYFFELRMMSFRTQAMDCKTTAGQIMVKEG